MSEVNDHIIGILQLSREMLYLADHGDTDRTDAGCGIVFGTVRDYAYKLRKIALQEIESHRKDNNWNSENDKKLKQLLMQ